jgi:uncharacterized protein (TIGR00369 family)
MHPTPPAPAVGADAPPLDLEQLAAVSVGTLADRMGIRFVEPIWGTVAATMPVEGNTQPYGILHGGASCVLAETVGSTAAALHAGEGRIAVGVDINATHHRSMTTGEVRAEATPLHLGRSSAQFEIVIVDAEGRRICTSRLTCALRDAR